MPISWTSCTKLCISAAALGFFMYLKSSVLTHSPTCDAWEVTCRFWSLYYPVLNLQLCFQCWVVQTADPQVWLSTCLTSSVRSGPSKSTTLLACNPPFKSPLDTHTTIALWLPPSRLIRQHANGPLAWEINELRMICPEQQLFAQDKISEMLVSAIRAKSFPFPYGLLASHW